MLVLFVLALTALWWWMHPVPRGDVRPTALALKINVNSAQVQDLQLLPGLGPQLAQQIIDYRDAHGPFAGLEDLQQVNGIGPRISAAIQPWIGFGPGQ